MEGHSWDYGDGSTGTTSTLTHTHLYTVPGVCIVTLTVTGLGGSDTLTRTGYISVTWPIISRVITYTYDHLYRLVDADYSTGERFEYAYDAVGNRQALTETLGVTPTVYSYVYDQANRLTSVDGITYTWDANGNLLSDGLRSFAYDAANRLTSVTSGTLTTTFEYDGLGNRVAQTVDGVETSYVLGVAGGLPEVIVATSGGASTYYVQVSGQILGQEESGAWAYILPDHLGSVRQLANAEGQVTLAQSYDPFGNMFETFGPGESDFAYTGEWWGSYNELLYLRARWYMPETGTFLSRDPHSGLAEKPQSLNGWNYVYGNPVNLTDESGKFPPLPDPPGRPYGESFQPDWDVCTTWSNSGYFRDLCNRAYQHSDRDAMERIYRLIATAEAPVMPMSAKALDHFLDGTSTPGETLYFPRWWYLRSPVTRAARTQLKQRILNYVAEARDECKCNIPPENPKHEAIGDINIEPGRFGIPDDRQTVLGAHFLNVDAYLNLNTHCVGWIKYEFYVYEYFDFRKGMGNTFTIPGLGWVVPTAWADFLVDDNRAAEYWTVVQWTDRDLYWNWR